TKPKHESNDQKQRNRDEEIDWSEFNRKAIRSSRGGRVSGKAWAAIVAIAIVAIGIFLSFYFNDESKSSQQETAATVGTPMTRADSLQKALLPNKGKTAYNAIPTISLSDTLAIGVIAATGKLEPVRVYTDISGKREPYWVELH